jgi:adenine phosphoribosyltransferase
MDSHYYQLDFFGLKRQLPLTFLSPKIMIANFNILGDVELTEKAGEVLEKILREKEIIPDCFIGPEVKVVPFVHHMAKRFDHKRYVILRKSVRGYMTNPLIEHPWETAPKHVKKLVLSGYDQEYLHGKKVILIDDVVSTGVTIELLQKVAERVGTTVLARCAIFKQGDRYQKELIYLAKLPLMVQ